MPVLKKKPRVARFSKQEALFSGNFGEKKGQFFESKLPHTLIICLSTIALVFLLSNRLPPQIPLFYGLPRGEEQLTTTFGLIIPSLTSIAIILVNYGISQVLSKDYFKRILSLASVGSVFLSTITTIKIIVLVGNF